MLDPKQIQHRGIAQRSVRPRFKDVVMPTHPIDWNTIIPQLLLREVEIENRGGVNEVFVTVDGYKVFVDYYGLPVEGLNHIQAAEQALFVAIQMASKGRPVEDTDVK